MAMVCFFILYAFLAFNFHTVLAQLPADDDWPDTVNISWTVRNYSSATLPPTYVCYAKYKANF